MNLDAFQRRVLLTVALAAVPAMQLILVSLHFDAYVIVLRDTVSGWRVIFGYFGQMAKIAVLFGFVFMILLQARLAKYWHALVSGVGFRAALRWVLPQLFSFACVYWLSAKIFDASASNVAAVYYALWLLAAVLCGVFSILLLAPANKWIAFVKAERVNLAFALCLAALVWLLSSLTSGFWGPMSEYTFVLVTLILSFIHDDGLYVDFDARVIGMNDFLVNIAPACSGYEGIGLVTAFTALYLYLFKSEFRFPRALVLFPIGALVIWLLNSLRIAALVLIGSYFSADVAVGGFHSQAGWITFIATSLGILWVARRLSFFAVQAPIGGKVAQPHAESSANSVGDSGLAIATLVPMVALLAFILLSTALSAGFDWLYPLRVLVVVAALYCLKSHFDWRLLIRQGFTIEAGIAGLTVALVWGLMLVGKSEESNQAFSAALWSAEAWLAYIWLGFRLFGSVVTVPIAEELAFRAYILCRLSGDQVKVRGPITLSVLGVLLSSIAFGALHGAWVAGTLAGLTYALVRLRSEHIGSAIVAHAFTNLLLFCYAAYSGEWALI